MPDKSNDPSRPDAKASAAKPGAAKPDGPPEIEDAAEQESVFPEDTTDEG